MNQRNPGGRPRVGRPPITTHRGSLAARIETLRVNRGFTQPELARLSGLGLGTIARLERGDVSPSAETLIAIAGAFGLTGAQLMRGVAGW